MDEELSSEQFEAIGKISVWFVRLERELLLAIADLTDMDEDLVLQLIATDSFDNLLSIFNRTFIYFMQSKKINDKDKKILSSEFDDLLRHLKKSNLGRNKTMHSYWFPADDGKIRRHKFNKKIKKNSSIDEYETITVESLNKLAKEITQSMFLLNEFRIKCSKLLSS